ncbi:MAG: 4Fe-4S binding protein [Limisphaerales bacterium]
MNPHRAALLRRAIWLLALGAVSFLVMGAEEMRFPAPEFKSEYSFPETTAPAANTQLREWVDLGIFTAALGLASWLAVKRRSRRGLFWLMLFSLGYFGFYKQGCICPIGSIQNVALSLSGAPYAIPLTVSLFFVLPLLFALFFGRVFCSSICALGAIQDLVVLKPLNLPRKVTLALSMIPFVYLGAAIVFAVTNTGFVICRFDPFIGFFRLGGNAPYLFLGAAFLLVGMFIARPYCRFFCPYGVLLGLMSRFSRHHLSITPTTCVNCRLCEASCPFDYIEKPNVGLAREASHLGVRRLGYLFLMIPVLIFLGGWIGNEMAIPMSRYNRTVALAEQVLTEKQNPTLIPTIETETFRAAGTTQEELVASAMRVRGQMKVGGILLGSVLGLVFGIKLIGISTVRTQSGYEVNKANCFSCARCCGYCPSDNQHKPNFVPESKSYQDALAVREAELPRANGIPDLVEGKV